MPESDPIIGSADRLVVDVGANHGEDTRYYLSLGFRVLAVEANPSLVRELHETFAPEIAQRRLVVAGVAVGDEAGVIDFHVSDDDLWSSTDLNTAGRGITSVTTVQVECVPLADLLAGGPVPYYVKIDVEGADAACLRSLAKLPEPPSFLSFEAEMSDPDATRRMVELAASYGYTRFKLVNQATHPPGFSPHSSGPLGDDAIGSWTSAETLMESFERTLGQQALRASYGVTGRVYGIPLAWAHRPLRWVYNSGWVTRVRRAWAGARGSEVGGWFDIHCAR